MHANGRKYTQMQRAASAIPPNPARRRMLLPRAYAAGGPFRSVHLRVSALNPSSVWLLTNKVRNKSDE